jgi:hypothetical protein
MTIARISGLASFCLLCWSAAASGAPIFYAIASAGATDHRPGGAQVAEVRHIPSGDTAGPATVSLPGGSAWASVVDGVLRAHATGDGSGVSTNATASFFDTLVLSSATLPIGTSVQLRAEMQFSRTVTPNDIPAPCANTSVAYAGIDTNAGSLQVQDSTCDSLDINNPTGFIQGIVGEELTVNAYLTAAVGAFGQGTADAANTFRFFLTPVGDFTYTTASGNSYVQQVQPVAEPATLLLLGIGVALPFWRARRLNAGHR